MCDIIIESYTSVLNVTKSLKKEIFKQNFAKDRNKWIIILLNNSTKEMDKKIRDF